MSTRTYPGSAAPVLQWHEADRVIAIGYVVEAGTNLDTAVELRARKRSLGTSSGPWAPVAVGVHVQAEAGFVGHGYGCRCWVRARVNTVVVGPYSSPRIEGAEVVEFDEKLTVLFPEKLGAKKAVFIRIGRGYARAEPLPRVNAVRPPYLARTPTHTRNRVQGAHVEKTLVHDTAVQSYVVVGDSDAVEAVWRSMFQGCTVI